MPGCEALSPLDPATIQAYLLLKAENETTRDKRVQPEQLLNALASEKAVATSGCSLSILMWVVPKSNFAQDILAAVQAQVKSEEYMRANYEIPDYFDFNEHLVVDSGYDKGACVGT